MIVHLWATAAATDATAATAAATEAPHSHTTTHLTVAHRLFTALRKPIIHRFELTLKAHVVGLVRLRLGSLLLQFSAPAEGNSLGFADIADSCELRGLLNRVGTQDLQIGAFLQVVLLMAHLLCHIANADELRTIALSVANHHLEVALFEVRL